MTARAESEENKRMRDETHNKKEKTLSRIIRMHIYPSFSGYFILYLPNYKQKSILGPD
jgi:hypothetical protein